MQQSVQDVQQTQKDESTKENTPPEATVQTKPVFLSSDEEESNADANTKKKSKKKRKHTLVYSGKIRIILIHLFVICATEQLIKYIVCDISLSKISMGSNLFLIFITPMNR